MAINPNSPQWAPYFQTLSTAGTLNPNSPQLAPYLSQNPQYQVGGTGDAHPFIQNVPAPTTPPTPSTGGGGVVMSGTPIFGSGGEVIGQTSSSTLPGPQIGPTQVSTYTYQGKEPSYGVKPGEKITETKTTYGIKGFGEGAYGKATLTRTEYTNSLGQILKDASGPLAVGAYAYGPHFEPVPSTVDLGLATVGPRAPMGPIISNPWPTATAQPTTDIISKIEAPRYGYYASADWQKMVGGVKQVQSNIAEWMSHASYEEQVTHTLVGMGLGAIVAGPMTGGAIFSISGPLRLGTQVFAATTTSIGLQTSIGISNEGPGYLKSSEAVSNALMLFGMPIAGKAINLIGPRVPESLKINQDFGVAATEMKTGVKFKTDFGPIIEEFNLGKNVRVSILTTAEATGKLPEIKTFGPMGEVIATANVRPNIAEITVEKFHPVLSKLFGKDIWTTSGKARYELPEAKEYITPKDMASALQQNNLGPFSNFFLPKTTEEIPIFRSFDINEVAPRALGYYALGYAGRRILPNVALGNRNYIESFGFTEEQIVQHEMIHKFTIPFMDEYISKQAPIDFARLLTGEKFEKIWARDVGKELHGIGYIPEQYGRESLAFMGVSFPGELTNPITTSGMFMKEVMKPYRIEWANRFEGKIKIGETQATLGETIGKMKEGVKLLSGTVKDVLNPSTRRIKTPTKVTAYGPETPVTNIVKMQKMEFGFENAVSPKGTTLIPKISWTGVIKTLEGTRNYFTANRQGLRLWGLEDQYPLGKGSLIQYKAGGKITLFGKEVPIEVTGRGLGIMKEKPPKPVDFFEKPGKIKHTPFNMGMGGAAQKVVQKQAMMFNKGIGGLASNPRMIEKAIGMATPKMTMIPVISPFGKTIYEPHGGVFKPTQGAPGIGSIKQIQMSKPETGKWNPAISMTQLKMETGQKQITNIFKGTTPGEFPIQQPRIDIIPAQAVEPEQAQQQRTAMAMFNPTEPLGPSIPKIKIPPFPFIPPAKHAAQDIFGVKKVFGKHKGPQTAYKPTLFAVTQKIKGKRAKFETGLGIRPIEL